MEARQQQSVTRQEQSRQQDHVERERLREEKRQKRQKLEKDLAILKYRKKGMSEKEAVKLVDDERKLKLRSMSERNWATRHLNWAWVLVCLAAQFVLPFGWLAVGLADPLASVLIFIVISLVEVRLIVYVTNWYLVKKNRSQWNLLLVVPLGFIFLLALENRSYLIYTNLEDQKRKK
ncbi:MAG: hypothetical protein ACXABY_11000 [Candidatus Thorarchaeota archaeon]|jgi:hypothetical protein